MAAISGVGRFCALEIHTRLFTAQKRRAEERATRGGACTFGQGYSALRGTRREPTDDVLLQQHVQDQDRDHRDEEDRKSIRLNSSHVAISYAVFCLKKKTKK